jgi:hypothetical protein
MSGERRGNLGPSRSGDLDQGEGEPAANLRELSDRMDDVQRRVESRAILGGVGGPVGPGSTAPSSFNTIASPLPAAPDPSSAPGREDKEELTKKPPAKVTTWKRSQLTPNTSRLSIGEKEELPLKGLQADVRIDGFRARVLLDCYYFNDRDRQYEGTFQLRLPVGASPYYFAFGETAYQRRSPQPKEPAPKADLPQFFTSIDLYDRGTRPEDVLALRSQTWRDPKEARIVPREKAAYSYGETVRRQIDPALVEWSGAGVFSSRVFPLAAGKLHRIVIGYDVDLLPAGDDLEYRLDLPEGNAQKAVDISLGGQGSSKARVMPDAKAAKVAGRAVYRFDNPSERAIAVRLEKPGSTLLTGTDPKAGAFFATRFRPSLPEAPAAAGSPRGVFLLDTSLSANPEQFNIHLKLLRAILERNRDSLKEFAVLCFNVEAFWWQDKFVLNTAENAEALAKFAETLALEGASDLGLALAEAAAPAWGLKDKSAGDAKIVPPAEGPWDVFLLSDAAVTWGQSDPHALVKALRGGAAGPLFAYATGLAGTDSHLMAHLARESGGAVFSVVGEAEVAKAATAHRTRPWEIIDVKIDGGSDLLVAGRPRAIFPGQNLLVVGRGTPGNQQPEVVLTLRQGAKQETARTQLASGVPSELAPRAYGQVAVDQLEELAGSAEEFATAYARQFRVTGRTCSLLMLETEDDYKRFNIKPEEDALVVQQKPAAALVNETLAKVAGSLADPKRALLAWLEKMEHMPGVEFKVPTAFRLALEKMPVESFQVAPPRLACQGRLWSDVPGELQEQLAAKELAYDAVAAEAQRRLQKWGPHDALRALSSLVESRPGDAATARDVAFSAMEWRLGGQAYHLLRRVAAARPYEPQTYHALARCLEEMAESGADGGSAANETAAKNADLALAYYEVALTGGWDGRFGEFKEIVAWDYLRLLRRIAAGRLQTSVPEFAAARLASLAEQQAAKGAGSCDLVVIITWNTDRTDVDLHVTDPAGEECRYDHPDTKLGGHITRDVTQGYGPEMFTLPKAAAGKYQVRVKYYAEDANRASTRTKVYATIYDGFGTPNEKVTRKTVTLAAGKDMHDIATVAR